MAFEIEGKLVKKFDTQQVTDKFQKREFVIEIEDGKYPQLIKFQMVQDNCDKLDRFSEGGQLKVTFSLKGREYSKDGNTSYFTNLDAWKVDSVGKQPKGAAAPAVASEEEDADDLPF